MRQRPGAVALIAGAVVLAGGVTWASDGEAGNYRTATAVTADVESTLSVSGTVASSARRDLSFGVAGTIDKVAVAVGDPVASGDKLVALDPEELDAAVTRAVADLARAKAQLEDDQIAQAATVTAVVESSADATEHEQVLSALGKQQRAVTAAQSAATEAIAAARAALEVQAAACAIGDLPGGEDPAEVSSDAEGEDDRADGDEQQEGADELGGEPSEPRTGEESPPDENNGEPSAPGTGEESPGDTGGTPVTPIPTVCTDTLAAVQARQDEVADRQATLQAALTALTGTLSDAIAQLLESAPDADQGQGKGQGQGQDDQAPERQSGPTSPSGNTGQEGGAPADAGSIASDQVAIDTAEAALTQARLARDSATMTAPFAGTVLDVGFRPGDDVSATDVTVVIVGDGGSTVTTTVTIEQVAQVSKGQSAHVVPAGADELIEGIVTEIGMLPSPTDTDTVAYPVTIDLTDDASAPEGAGASVEIVTKTVEDAVTVPSSAVTNTGQTTVTVLIDGLPSTLPVTVGVVGTSRTSITEGLEPGQQVVLADLDAPLPGDDTEVTTGPGGLGGRPGGAGPGGRGVRPQRPN